MIYLFARARRADLPARTLLVAGLLEDDFFALNLLLPDVFFSVSPRLRGRFFPPSPTKTARTHTTGGNPSMIARQDLPSSLEP